MLGQQFGVVWASNSSGGTTGAYTVFVPSRDISAEVVLTQFDVLGREGSSAQVGILHVLSDEKGEENFFELKPGMIFRRGVLSVTFHVFVFKGYVEGRWLINFWS